MSKKLKYVTDEMIVEFEDIGEESFTTFDYEKVYKELEKYIKEFRELRSQNNYKDIELYEIGEYLKILLTNIVTIYYYLQLNINILLVIFPLFIINGAYVFTHP